ncbi:MAG: Prolyl-tRNA synthetase [Candidatus Levybacteria bacterium]|nr:Prolyl-tRNA synthetase [Candidatus Levybacteria bacterium]
MKNAQNPIKYYDEIKEVYLKVFKRMGLTAILTEAGGGVFTKNVTHEFQVIAESGEDEIIYCSKGDFSANVEVSSVKEGAACSLGHGPLRKTKVIEVGNIFPLGTYYSEKMNVNFTDKNGKRQPVWLASYGIGLTRAVGAIVEVHHDEKGIVWPKEVAPYDVHLINLKDQNSPVPRGGNLKSESQNSKLFADEVYEKLQEVGMEVLYDDRDISAGVKFADADLIGIPVRLVVSKRNADKIEFKERASSKSDLLTPDQIIKRLA